MTHPERSAITDRYNTSTLLTSLWPLATMPVQRHILAVLANECGVPMTARQLEHALTAHGFIRITEAPQGFKGRYYVFTPKFKTMVRDISTHGQVYEVVAYSGPHPGYREEDKRRKKTTRLFNPLEAKKCYDSLTACLPNERRLFLNGFPYNLLALSELCPPDPPAEPDPRRTLRSKRDWLGVDEAVRSLWDADIDVSKPVLAKALRDGTCPATKHRLGFYMIKKTDLGAFALNHTKKLEKTWST